MPILASRFEAQLRRETLRVVGGGFLDLVADVTLDFTSKVVLATPRDSGEAASEWAITTGSPATNRIELSGESPSSAVSRIIDEGRAAMRSGFPSPGASRDLAAFVAAVPVVHVTNLAPYASFLDEGSSDQARPGFVEDLLSSADRVAQGTDFLFGGGF